MNTNEMYKNIWRGTLLCYFLSDREQLKVARTFVKLNDGNLLYYVVGGNRFVFSKENLYHALELNGFTIKEFVHKDEPKISAFFFIDKNVVKNKLQKAREEKSKVKEKTIQ